MTFDDSFNAWLRSSVSTVIPQSVRAFSFNLSDSAHDDAHFGVELIGSPDFDIEDGDWACEEVWEASPRILAIPVAFSTSSWETCLDKMKRLVQAALDDGTVGEILKTREGIAVGFIDGYLARLCPSILRSRRFQ
jgi:hypothetical protein